MQKWGKFSKFYNKLVLVPQHSSLLLYLHDMTADIITGEISQKIITQTRSSEKLRTYR